MNCEMSVLLQDRPSQQPSVLHLAIATLVSIVQTSDSLQDAGSVTTCASGVRLFDRINCSLQVRGGSVQPQNKITGPSREILFELLPPQTQDLHGFFMPLSRCPTSAAQAE